MLSSEKPRFFLGFLSSAWQASGVRHRKPVNLSEPVGFAYPDGWGKTADEKVFESSDHKTCRASARRPKYVSKCPDSAVAYNINEMRLEEIPDGRMILKKDHTNLQTKEIQAWPIATLF